MQSLYIHFPFCESKCHYCDFYSLGQERTRSQDADRFERALHQEVTLCAPLLCAPLKTLFFGGGTPSLTPFESSVRALAPLWKHTQTVESTEWTMEANPSSISLQSLQSFRSYGVNRISMGVQALNPSLLKLLGRVHSPETALESLDTVFQAGYENVSVDLLCGIPGQSEKDIEQALERLTSFPITHLSCYLLTLAPHHSLYRQLPNEDIQLTHLLLVHDWMTAHGFEHYEISNFAKPGKQAQHNLQYWKGESYLGLGPSAHSYDKLAQRRWKNVSSLHQYVQRLLEQNKDVREWTESLTTQQKELEKWMLALRLNEGFPTQWLDSPLRQSRAKLLESDGLLEAHPQFPLRKRLTARGFALSDSIIRSLA